MNKAGVKTTEFWVTMLTVAYAMFGGSLGITESDAQGLIAKIAAGIVSLIYVISRAKLKTTENQNTNGT